VVDLSVTDKWGQVTTNVVHVLVTSAAPAVGCYLARPGSSSTDYPGTYTFSDTDRSQFPVGWAFGAQAADGSMQPDLYGQHVRVLHEVVGGHADVLELTKDGTAGMVLAETQASPSGGQMSAGAVECWLDITGDSGVAGGLLLVFSDMDNNGNKLGGALAMAGINVTVVGGNGHYNVVVMNSFTSAALDMGSCLAGWHHFLVSFSLDGTLEGSTFTVNVDSGLLVSTQSLGSPATTLSAYGFLIGTPVGNPLAGQGQLYVDGIGVSWDPYYAIGMDEQGSQGLSRADLSGVYPATYQFTQGDVPRLQSDWIIGPWSTSSQLALVTNCMGHASALAMYAPPSSNPAMLYTNISASGVGPQSSGTVELWFTIDGDESDSFFGLTLGHGNPGGGSSFITDFEAGAANGQFAVGDFSNPTQVCPVSYDTWHHLRLDFAVNGSEYSGLQDQVRVQLDGNEPYVVPLVVGEDIGFVSLVAGSQAGTDLVTACVDAIGFSWDPTYVIGENLVPGSLGPVPEANIDAMTPGYRLVWTPIDANILPRFANYTLYCDGVAVESEIPWTSGMQVSYDLSDLTPGDYIFTAVFNNGYGMATNNTVIVHVMNVPPVVTAPTNASYEVGLQDFQLAWNITDSSYAGTSFDVYVDNVLAPVVPIGWQSGVPVSLNLGGLLPGLHNVTLAAHDGYGGVGAGTCWVNVTDAAPVLTVPANMTFVEGTPGETLSWGVTDPSVSSPTYLLSCNGTVVQGGAWASGAPVISDVSGLSAGLYNLTLVVNDGYGTISSGTSWVLVDDVVQVSHPADFSFQVGTPDQTIAWNLSDLIGSSDASQAWTATWRDFNGTSTYVLASGTWISGTTIPALTTSVSELPAGLYVVTLTASDGLGSTAQDDVVVLVTPLNTNAAEVVSSTVTPPGPAEVFGVNSTAAGVNVTMATNADTRVAIGIWDSDPVPANPDFASAGTFFTVAVDDATHVEWPFLATVSVTGGFPSWMTEADARAYVCLMYYDEASGAWEDSGFPIVAVDLAAGTVTFAMQHCSTFAAGLAPTMPPLAIDGADKAVGFGSDGQFGVTVSLNPPAGAHWTVHVALEDANGLLYSNVSSADVTGYTSLNLRLKVLFNAAGTTGDGLSGTFYHYRVWVTQEDGSVVAEEEIDNVSIYHWSTWDGWNVSWDAIPMFNEAGYNVYVKAAYWDAATGLCYDSVDANGNLIFSSAFIGQQPAAGEMSLSLPSYGTMSMMGYDASTFMAGYGSGWYYFTYVAPADAANPWAERIGCPALAVC